jgi:DNA-binding LacI/PurR family transcriptional regulator
VARRLAKGRNQIVGVFTYEPTFPSSTGDFYHPFLVGIEERAEAAGSDLLLLTSAPVRDGRRRIFHEGNRVKLADACILLGRRIDHDELARLNTEGFPYVCVGRRDDAGGPVPYIGADYASPTASLVIRLGELGHRRMAFLGPAETAESSHDRHRGWRTGTRRLGIADPIITVDERDPADLLQQLLGEGVTAVAVEDQVFAVALRDAAKAQGLALPDELSMVVLGGLSRAVRTDVEFTGFVVPRLEMGRQAFDVLIGSLDAPDDPPVQRLLACTLVTGATVAPARDH